MRALFWLGVVALVCLAVSAVMWPSERFNGRDLLAAVLAVVVVLNLRAVEA